VEEEHAQVIHAVQGQRIWLDSATVLDVLHPMQGEIRPSKGDDINDTSIVAVLTFGKSKMLLTGDAGIEIESKLLPHFDFNSDLLKVGHHGSKHSTSENFLDEVTPQFAVIQSGTGNRYGHPTPEILSRLESNGIEVLRNDKMGDVEMVSDGARFSRK
jgi:beta-lactamase superfamily II metal-dependent hydrolase